MRCAKKAYATRAAARAKARRNFPGEHLRAYWCDTCASWHNGHLPRNVRKGRIHADHIYGDASPGL